MAPDSRSQAIDRQVMSWPGVSKSPHRFGGAEYRLGRREIGHVHGESLVDVPLPRRLRDELVRQGRARPHHVLPESGWVSVPMRSLEDVAEAVSILRHSYDLACAQRAKRLPWSAQPVGAATEGQMAKPLFRFFNRIHIFLYRLTAGKLGGRIQGLGVLLLTTTGRRSGKQRTVPLGFFEDGGAWVIIASNAGFDVHPGWFFNLRSDSRVRVEVAGKVSPAHAQIVDGEERARLWNRLISQSPGYARYEKSTRRVIPLVALHPVA